MRGDCPKRRAPTTPAIRDRVSSRPRMPRIELSGTELHTIEVAGSITTAAARALIPAALPLHEPGVGAELGLLCFAMQGLGMTRPLRLGPRLDYGEALWRVGVLWAGQPAWFAVACDLDNMLVRRLGATLVRYPVRRAAIVVEHDRARIDRGGQHLEISAEVSDETPPPLPPRPLLVAHGGNLYTIPWREEPAPRRHLADITIEDSGLARATLGAAPRWHTRGLVHGGRIHRCGVASRA